MKKNIIFYFTDQQRSDTCGCFGQPLDITPNLDALASEGVKLRQRLHASAGMRTLPVNIPNREIRDGHRLL